MAILLKAIDYKRLNKQNISLFAKSFINLMLLTYKLYQNRIINIYIIFMMQKNLILSCFCLYVLVYQHYRNRKIVLAHSRKSRYIQNLPPIFLHKKYRVATIKRQNGQCQTNFEQPFNLYYLSTRKRNLLHLNLSTAHSNLLLISHYFLGKKLYLIKLPSLYQLLYEIFS